MSIIAKILPGNLLERQVADILKDARAMGRPVKSFAKIAFPIVRRVLPSLVAGDLTKRKVHRPTIHQLELFDDEGDSKLIKIECNIRYEPAVINL